MAVCPWGIALLLGSCGVIVGSVDSIHSAHNGSSSTSDTAAANQIFEKYYSPIKFCYLPFNLQVGLVVLFIS